MDTATMTNPWVIPFIVGGGICILALATILVIWIEEERKNIKK